MPFSGTVEGIGREWQMITFATGMGAVFPLTRGTARRQGGHLSAPLPHATTMQSVGAQLVGLFSCSFRLGFVASHWRGVSTYVPSARSRNAVIALALIGAPLQPT